MARFRLIRKNQNPSTGALDAPSKSMTVGKTKIKIGDRIASDPKITSRIINTNGTPLKGMEEHSLTQKQKEALTKMKQKLNNTSSTPSTK